MNKDAIEDVIKQVVLANADNEILSIAVVMINREGNPEIQLAMTPNTVYSVISSLEILKMQVISKVMTDGTNRAKDRD